MKAARWEAGRFWVVKSFNGVELHVFGELLHTHTRKFL